MDQNAGLKDLWLLRDINDPNTIVFIFFIEDIQAAKAFTETPQASAAQYESGIIGAPEVLFLEEI